MGRGKQYSVCVCVFCMCLDTPAGPEPNGWRIRCVACESWRGARAAGADLDEEGEGGRDWVLGGQQLRPLLQQRLVRLCVPRAHPRQPPERTIAETAKWARPAPPLRFAALSLLPCVALREGRPAPPPSCVGSLCCAAPALPCVSSSSSVSPNACSTGTARPSCACSAASACLSGAESGTPSTCCCACCAASSSSNILPVSSPATSLTWACSKRFGMQNNGGLDASTASPPLPHYHRLDAWQ